MGDRYPEHGRGGSQRCGVDPLRRGDGAGQHDVDRAVAQQAPDVAGTDLEQRHGKIARAVAQGLRDLLALRRADRGGGANPDGARETATHLAGPLELPHGLRYRLLTQVEALRCAGEAEFLGNRDEGPELAQIRHGHIRWL
jgi:hypothetical protein